MTIKSPQTDGELAIKFIREYHRQNPKASRANARGALSALLSTINHSHPKTVAEFNRQLDGLYGWDAKNPIHTHFGQFAKTGA